MHRAPLLTRTDLAIIQVVYELSADYHHSHLMGLWTSQITILTSKVLRYHRCWLGHKCRSGNIGQASWSLAERVSASPRLPHPVDAKTSPATPCDLHMGKTTCAGNKCTPSESVETCSASAYVPDSPSVSSNHSYGY